MPPIEIYLWNLFCQGQRRATSFIAFAVFFSMSKRLTVGRCRREWGLREGVKLLLGFGQREKVTDFGRPQKMLIASLHLLKWMASARTYFNALNMF